MNRHLNKMYVSWLDEIKDFRFDLTHLLGVRNPTDPLSRRGFADCDGPAASTGDPDKESHATPPRRRSSQQQSRVGGQLRRCGGCVRKRPGGGHNPFHTARGEDRPVPPCTSMFILCYDIIFDIIDIII